MLLFDSSSASVSKGCKIRIKHYDPLLTQIKFDIPHTDIVCKLIDYLSYPTLIKNSQYANQIGSDDKSILNVLNNIFGQLCIRSVRNDQSSNGQ